MNPETPYTLRQIKKYFHAADACCLACTTEGVEDDVTNINHGSTHVLTLIGYITDVLIGETTEPDNYVTPEDLAKFLYHDILGNL